MKCQVEKSDLAPMLRLIKQQASTTGKVMLETQEEDRLRVIGLHRDTWVIGEIGSRNEAHGTAVLDAALFSDVVDEFSVARRIHLEVRGRGEVVIKNDRTKIVLARQSAKIFDACPDLRDWQPARGLLGRELCDAIDRTLPSARVSERGGRDGEDVDHRLYGAHVAIDPDGLRLAAADGHRLSVHTVPSIRRSSSHGADAARSRGHLVCRHGIETIRAALMPDALCQIGFSSTHMIVVQRSICARGSIAVAARLPSLEFPAYTHLLPTSFQAEVTIHRAGLLNAMRRAQICLSGQAPWERGVMLEISPGLSAVTGAGDQEGNGGGDRNGDPDRNLDRDLAGGAAVLRVQNVDGGIEYVEVIDATCTGRSAHIRLNPAYVADWLAPLDCADVWIGLGGPLDPAMFRARVPAEQGADLGLIMPMRS